MDTHPKFLNVLFCNEGVCSVISKGVFGSLVNTTALGQNMRRLRSDLDWDFGTHPRAGKAFFSFDSVDLASLPCDIALTIRWAISCTAFCLFMYFG